MTETFTYLADKFNDLAKLYHTAEYRLKALEEDILLIRKEFVEMRSDYLKFESRLSHLEEVRNTLSAEMRTLKGRNDQRTA